MNLREPRLLGLLGGVLALQLWTLTRIDGYQLADSIEYLERARRLHAGEPIDPRGARPFLYSALWWPLFRLFDLCGADGYRGLVAIARGVQIVIGLCVVSVVARFVGRATDRRAGLVAALFVGTSFTFLRWSVTPVTELSSMLCIALGLERLMEPSGERSRKLWGGALLLASVLFTYKSLPVVGVLALAFLLRELHARRRRDALALLAGALGVVLAACVVDALAYGSFGAGLVRYTTTNVASVATRALQVAGLDDMASYLRNTFLVEGDARRPGVPPLRQVDSAGFYVAELARQLTTWPFVVLGVLGAVGALTRRHFAGIVCALALVLFGLLLSSKGSKSFRLLLPALPALALLVGLGWRQLCGPAGASRVRTLVGASALVLATLSLLHRLQTVRFDGHAAYWRAIEVVNEAARDAEQPTTVAAAYDWAIALRESSHVVRRRLPVELLHLEDLAPDAPQRRATLDALASYDWFIGHLQLLRQRDVMAVLGPTYEVQSLYNASAELEPVVLLRRRTAGERTFFDHYPSDVGVDLAELRAGLSQPLDVHFEYTHDDGRRQRLELLGWDVETDLAPGVAWVTLLWRAGTDGILDFGFFTSAESLDADVGEAEDLRGLTPRSPAHDVLPTSGWRRGDVLRESYAYSLSPAALQRTDPSPDRRYRLWLSIRRGGGALPLQQMQASGSTEIRDNAVALGIVELRR